MAAIERETGRDLAREEHRYELRERIAAVVGAWCGERTLANVRAAFDAQRVCWGLYRTTRDLFAHDPRVGPTNPVWERLETAGVGVHRAAGTPIRAAGEARAPSTPAPLIGAHTDEVLHEVLGLDAAAIGRLHDAAVVAGPERDPTRQQRQGQ